MKGTILFRSIFRLHQKENQNLFLLSQTHVIFRLPTQDFHSGYPGRVHPNLNMNPTPGERRIQAGVVSGTDLTPEPLYFEVTEVYVKLNLHFTFMAHFRSSVFCVL